MTREQRETGSGSGNENDEVQEVWHDLGLLWGAWVWRALPGKNTDGKNTPDATHHGGRDRGLLWRLPCTAATTGLGELNAMVDSDAKQAAAEAAAVAAATAKDPRQTNACVYSIFFSCALAFVPSTTAWGIRHRKHLKVRVICVFALLVPVSSFVSFRLCVICRYYTTQSLHVPTPASTPAPKVRELSLLNVHCYRRVCILRLHACTNFTCNLSLCLVCFVVWCLVRSFFCCRWFWFNAPQTL